MNTDKTATETNTEAKRASTIASNRAKRIADRGYSLPLILTCVVTGKTVKYTSPTYVEKTAAKYGGLEQLRKNYVSREGKRLQAEKSAKA